LIASERRDYAEGRYPKGRETASRKNRWFEALALIELQSLPRVAWENMDALWRTLPLAYPSTRKRILARCFQLAAKRADRFSAKLMQRVAPLVIRELAVSEAPRAGVHDQIGLKKVAWYKANKPDASLSELANAGQTTKGTVRQRLKQPEFNAWLKDEKLLAQLAAASRRRSRGPKRKKRLCAGNSLDARLRGVFPCLHMFM
jgi:hypothetical protein